MSEELKRLRDDRKITQAQYKRAQLGTDPRVTDEGNLWVTLTRGRRVMIDSKGLVAFDGKRIVR